MSIIFKGVEIKRDWDGKLTGQLDIKCEFGRVFLNLTEDLCARILQVCADNIIEVTVETEYGEFRRESLQLSTQTIDAKLSK